MNTSSKPNRTGLFVALLGVVVAFSAVIIALALSAETRHGRLNHRVQGEGRTIDARPVAPAITLADATSAAPKASAPATAVADASQPDPDLESVMPVPWGAPGAVAPVPVLGAPLNAGEVRPALQRSEAPAAAPAPKPLVTVVDSAVAKGIVDRVPEGLGEAFTVDSEAVWAWIKVANPGPPTHITMVWRKGDEVGFTIDLDVGTSSAWRTWSRKTVRRYDAGQWSVDILDANGVPVHTIDFEVRDPTGAALPT